MMGADVRCVSLSRLEPLTFPRGMASNYEQRQSAAWWRALAISMGDAWCWEIRPNSERPGEWLYRPIPGYGFWRYARYARLSRDHS